MFASGVVESLICPRCGSSLCQSETITCRECRTRYPRLGSIPVLLNDAPRYLLDHARALVQLERQARKTALAIEAQSSGPDVLPLTKKRCLGAMKAVRDQINDVVAILRPVLPREQIDVDAEEPPGHAASLIEQLPYLYRDWGWPAAPGDENERALFGIERVLSDARLGRTLVIGGGACRLAYDLHRRHADTDTVVLDVDPLLFTVAHTVIRGGVVMLTEANAGINEIQSISRRWPLRAPDGAIDASRFQFLVADGLEPPFGDRVFDTVITTWFIDVIPSDLRDFISTVYRVLKADGQWLNLGPLRYPEHRHFTRRFTRDEIFDLLRRAGFAVGAWRVEVGPHLVSEHNHRGNVDWVLMFRATKGQAYITEEGGSPPGWLLFRHIPVPKLTGSRPAGRAFDQLVASLVDGQRTREDITKEVARRLPRAAQDGHGVADAVKHCLLAIHKTFLD